MRPTHSVSRKGGKIVLIIETVLKNLNVAKDVPMICLNLIIAVITISEKKWEVILLY